MDLRSICTLVLVDGMLQSKTFVSKPMYPSSGIAIHISSTLLQSSMSIHDTIALMLMHHAWDFFIFVCLMVCLDSMTAINVCGPGMCSILMLYWCILNSIP